MFLAVDHGRAPDAAPIHIYNLGHSETLEVNESIRLLCRELGVEPQLHYSGGNRGWVGDAPHILLDTSKIRALGWTPTKSIEDSVIETVRFIQANPFLHQPPVAKG